MKTFRILLSSLVVLVIAGLFFLLKPDGRQADQATDAPQAQPQSDSGAYSGIGK